ncbi:hypothetical protein [Rubinisphaera margarita]|uniref:hypothetical protein n=1 Tax=Rubinisphaera margarita TaxID=2909586 RepID=UPI001EE7C154|nr:hypothetical protein [Rubinisphaera margarita]MCG6157392.1 hypothetical protein [Rubinisphaera margarita]
MIEKLRRRTTDLVQLIEEIPPPRPICVKLTTWTGVCEECGREVESTHPLQTSTACGVGFL